MGKFIGIDQWGEPIIVDGMNIKCMTRKELHKAMLSHRFLAVRWNDGAVTGANSIIALRGRLFRDYPIDDTETRIISYRPIGFQEYITLKTPFC